MRKKGLTQWQYNKMKSLIKFLLDKYSGLVIADVELFCEVEGIDISGWKGK